MIDEKLNYSSASENKIVQNMKLTSIRESSYDLSSSDNPYNPDALVKKSNGFDIYDEMRLDDQVSVCLQMKKDLVIGSGWDVIASDDEQADIAKDIAQTLIEDVARPFDEQLEEIISAYEYGFSVSEKLFAKRSDGYLSFKEFRTRHPNTWMIETDISGNVEKYTQRGGRDGDIVLKPQNLLHYVNHSRFQNPYGESDLRVAYEAWFAKKEVIKYFAIFLEKAASPIPVGKYSQGYTAAQKQDFLNILKRFQAKTALAIPKESEIQFLESSNKGESYRTAINLFNMFIGRSLMIPDLLGFQGDETSGGSYALGKEQLRIFFMHIGRRRKYLERVINQHVIRPLAGYNWGLFEDCPKFQFKPISEESAFEAIMVWKDVVAATGVKPNQAEMNHVRSLLNFPEGDLEHKPIPTFPPMGQNNTPPVPKPPSVPAPEEVEEEGEGLPEKSASFSFKPTQYGKKVNFKKIESQLDNYFDSTVDAIKPVIETIFNDLAEQIAKKKILEKRDITRVDSLKIKNLREIKRQLKSAFQEHYQESKVIAHQEIYKVNYSLPLPTDEFLQFLEAETFSFVGDWAYKITQNTKQMLISAIKDGKPLVTVQSVLRDDGSRLALVGLERYARTKFTEVMNRSRLDYFESSGVVQGYEYSAILDGVTSEICESLDGKIFKEGEQPVPPMHFNCRSLLIPITIYEDVKKFDDVPASTAQKIEDGKFSLQ